MFSQLEGESLSTLGPEDYNGTLQRKDLTQDSDLKASKAIAFLLGMISSNDAFARSLDLRLQCSLLFGRHLRRCLHSRQRSGSPSRSLQIVSFKWFGGSGNPA